MEALEKGTLSGNPICGCRMVLQDGGYHIVDSSELAFRIAAIGAFREIYRSAVPVVLEPIMTVEVVAPAEFQSTFTRWIVVFQPNVVDVLLGSVIGGLNTRRGTIVDSEVHDDEFTCVAEVALNDMFGYSNQLRGSTQGKGVSFFFLLLIVPWLTSSVGEFSMEYKVRSSLQFFYFLADFLCL